MREHAATADLGVARQVVAGSRWDGAFGVKTKSRLGMWQAVARVAQNAVTVQLALEEVVLTTRLGTIVADADWQSVGCGKTASCRGQI